MTAAPRGRRFACVEKNRPVLLIGEYAEPWRRSSHRAWRLKCDANDRAKGRRSRQALRDEYRHRDARRCDRRPDPAGRDTILVSAASPLSQALNPLVRDALLTSQSDRSSDLFLRAKPAERVAAVLSRSRPPLTAASVLALRRWPPQFCQPNLTTSGNCPLIERCYLKRASAEYLSGLKAQRFNCGQCINCGFRRCAGATGSQGGAMNKLSQDELSAKARLAIVIASLSAPTKSLLLTIGCNLLLSVDPTGNQPP